MSSIQPTTESSSSPVQKVVNYLNRKGKLELWSGVLANQMIQDHRNEQRKNQAAEGAFVRRQVWGEKPGQSIEDDMGTTILGDVTNPTPIVINSQPQQSGSALKTLAILAAGALIPGAGIAGYFASQLLKPTTTETTAPEDQTLDLGLLRFEDLEPKEGTKPQ
jgi:hypothetical protein